MSNSDPRSSPAPQMMATTSSSSLTTPATQMMATTSMKSRMQTLYGLSHIVPKTKTVQNEHLHKFAEIIAEMPYDFCTATNCDVNEKRCLCCKSPAPKFVCKWHHMNVCTGCYATAHRLCRNCVAMIGEWARTTAQDEPGTCSVCFTSNNSSAMCSTCHPKPVARAPKPVARALNYSAEADADMA